MDEFEIVFIVSVIINMFAFAEFWVFWIMAKKQYEGIRNFFMRNAGYGYLLILYPEGRIKKIFKKLRTTMGVDKEKYILKHERVYRFEGMPTLIYNKGDSMPIELTNLKKDELWANAKWLDNIFANVKAGAEAEAEAKNSFNTVLLYVAIGVSIIAVGVGVYIIYMLQNPSAAGVVLSANP